MFLLIFFLPSVLATIKGRNRSEIFCLSLWMIYDDTSYLFLFIVGITYKEICEPVGPREARIRSSWHSWPQSRDRTHRSLVLHTSGVINCPDLNRKTVLKLSVCLSTFFYSQCSENVKVPNFFFSLLKQLELFKRFVPYDL